MERTISATPRHSEDELKQLFTKTLKLSSLWYAYEMLKDDSAFVICLSLSSSMSSVKSVIKET